MSKETIKSILRENLFDKIKGMSKTPKTEEAKTPAKAPESKGGDDEKGKQYQNDYSEITRKLNSTMLKASQVMQAAGLGDADDATARSLFSKKLRKETNTEGGQYLFSPEEVASIVKIINNPASYLNKKN